MRRLVLVTAIASVVAAFGTSPANAQSVEVTKEATDTHCPEVMLVNHLVDGGCEVHLPQYQTVRFYVMGGTILLDSCTLELWMSVNEDGFGYFHNQVMNPANCNVWVCQEAGGGKKPWSFQISEDGAGTERIYTAWCLRGITGGEFICNVDFTWTNLGSHSYEMAGLYTQPSFCEGVVVSIAGYWRTEVDANTNIEVTHL